MKQWNERIVRYGEPGLIALFAVVGAPLSVRPAAVAWPMVAVAIVGSFALANRQVTGWALAAGLAVPTAALTIVGAGNSGTVAWMGFCVIGAWIGLSADARVAVVVGVVLVAILLAQFAVETSEPGWFPWIAGTSFAVVACIFARKLQDTVAELKSAQEKLALQTREEERARIAAEVHDVVGHALTVSLLHVASARLALDEPDEADRALAEAERLTRSSLDEVRATVGLMRSSDGAGVAPLPAAPDIPALVETYRRAGTPISLEISGDLGAVGATRGLAAYRVVQESLTNAIRHAPGCEVTVRLTAADDSLEVCVDNTGDFGSRVAAGTGLHAMAERAEAVGGQVSAGAYSGGWRVEAVLPR